jgi:uncharacterized SAM-binding protein YcdF (DUF218 family)
VITRRARIVRGALLSVAAAFVVGAVSVAPSAGTALVVTSPLSSPDTIVSLASHEWERLPAAAALARRYPHALVLLTLPRFVNPFNCHDCAHRAERLVQAGVPIDRIRVVALTESGTYGEAVATRAFVTGRHLSSVLVVTSPYHTRRSLALFRKVLGNGVSVGVAPATATSPARPERWWAASYDRDYVAYEWTAVLYYWLRHGVPLVNPRTSSG